MQQYRAGEEGQPLPPRSDRFYKVGDDWYFQVRGGACFGPFTCRGEAERAVRIYFSHSQDTDATPAGNGAVIHPFGSLRAKRWRKQFR
ncbi:DUF6316 family protein [Microbulbifer marinus]|uniref:DUF6316 domain-containing protein n=1 Tax=Microbulbifer marinus TaxID=658218 RepID=A0A1H3YQ80_9GAMM|nr:DUF6316 family protein [Microbulbifer marinus]SEA13537.1 hypothetical protein SAMN05216562_1907 [Microbulbifer marinus]